MCAGELKVGAEGASAPPVGTWEHCLERRILPNLITYALHQQNVKQIKYVASVKNKFSQTNKALKQSFDRVCMVDFSILVEALPWVDPPWIVLKTFGLGHNKVWKYVEYLVKHKDVQKLIHFSQCFPVLKAFSHQDWCDIHQFIY